MKQDQGIHRPPRVQFYLGSDEAVQAMAELRAYYSTQSNPHAALRAICDYAKSLREPKPEPAQSKRVTLSRRVY